MSRVTFEHEGINGGTYVEDQEDTYYEYWWG